MTKKQWEADAKDRFLQFLKEQHGQAYVVTGEDVSTNPLTRRDFDYELTANAQNLPVIALEIFRVVGDEGDLGQHRAWSDIALRLTTELEARGASGYLITTPRFNVPKFKREQFARNTADLLVSAIANHPDDQEFEADGYRFYKAPGDAEVRFSHIGDIRQINPFATLNEVFDNLLPAKNEQLNTQGRLRILLMLNAGEFPYEEHDVRQYFSTKDLEEFPNIDKAFFEVAPEKISLVFDRQVFDSYRQEKLPENAALADLFFDFVAHRLSFRDKKAFEITRKMVEEYGNLDCLSSEGKDALISCAEDFVQEADWLSVLWVIDQLKNDADPPFPNPMHDQVAKGEDYRLIVSVRGRLCWLIQKIIIHNLIDHYSPMLDILEGYAFGADLYVRSQACIPLAEMAVRRRQQLPSGARFMPENIAERIKVIALSMLRNAGTNPALLEDVSMVLRWIGDLGEEEAAEVLDRLSGVADTTAIHNRCGLLLYFSLFREKQFADLPRFNSGSFKERLHQELRDGESRFRTSLIWQMAGGADDKTYPYETIEPYLSSFVAGPYCDGGFFNLRRICDAHIRSHTRSVCTIMLAAMEKLVGYIAEDPRSNHWKVFDLQECFDLIAENCPEGCVLDTIALVLKYRARIPGLSVNLAGTLGRCESARAQELRELLR